MTVHTTLATPLTTATATAAPPTTATGADDLVGREAELLATAGRLHDPAVRLLTLTGPAGVGKSRLAELAAREARAAFRTVVTLDLAATADPAPPTDRITRAVAENLAVDPTDDPAGRLLLVLDGCDHAGRPEPAALAALLTAEPGLTLLATALRPLGVYGEHLMPVAPLPVPLPEEWEGPDELGRVPAVELFVRRAVRVRPGFALTEENADAVAALCRLLEGLPLAVELAAGRLRLFPPHELLDQLRRAGVDSLAGGAAYAPPRHRSLAALARWQCEDLDPAALGLLGRLSVHVDGFASGAVDRQEAAAFERLLDHGALTVSASRFTVPEPLRSNLRGAQPSSAHDRHAEHYQQLVAAAAPRLAGTEQAHWLAVLAAEGPNTEAALDHLQGRGDHQAAAATALACLEPWLSRGRLRPALDRYDRLAAAPGLPEQLTAQLTDASGVLTLALGHPADAAEAHRQAQAAGRRVGDRRIVTLATARLGAALLAAGDLPAARAALESAITAQESMGAAGQAARSATALARTLWAQGQQRPALAVLERALTGARRTRDGRGLAQAHHTAAAIAADRGDHAEADRHLRECLTLHAAAGERTELPAALEAFALLTLAAAPAQQPRVARLITAAGRLRAALGTQPDATAGAALDEALDGLRARMGWTGFTVAHAEGARLDAAAAVQEALSTPAPGRPAKDQEDQDRQRLTPRQLQVAMLVSEGLTNRQIAERLGLSEWTAVNHVRQVMRRLGCTSRVQVAWSLGRRP
ncbi:LuxR C-terminal-related transcriptional regulator [Streptomyces sp. SP17BM10]|uniref:ATP-binding protein n=1 Tax=Streptomyces sp. SP17BM10 TaxID=3002530 RepID=UPI002E7A50F5|nr:LuxR C-terminal-related transcriptional regulator [Streptomyces sp. SP17BM10]MEE1781609.1 LuxR C-terminal-related transcriptional regulator [Streptomyces sp. SP17BM10]